MYNNRILSHQFLLSFPSSRLLFQAGILKRVHPWIDAGVQTSQEIRDDEEDLETPLSLSMLGQVIQIHRQHNGDRQEAEDVAGDEDGDFLTDFEAGMCLSAVRGAQRPLYARDEDHDDDVRHTHNQECRHKHHAQHRHVYVQRTVVGGTTHNQRQDPPDGYQDIDVERV